MISSARMIAAYVLLLSFLASPASAQTEAPATPAAEEERA